MVFLWTLAGVMLFISRAAPSLRAFVAVTSHTTGVDCCERRRPSHANCTRSVGAPTAARQACAASAAAGQSGEQSGSTCGSDNVTPAEEAAL